MKSEYPFGYIKVEYPDPHKLRNREILVKYPEVKQLFGPTPSTLFFCVLCVSLQLWLAIMLRDLPLWEIFLLSYLVGAVFNHAFFVLNHECTHNLVFRSTTLNKLLGIFVNLPIVVPMAISFRKYHLLHHKHQGELNFDADLPTLTEATLVHNRPYRKILWLLVFTLIEGIVRPRALKSVRLFDRWTFFNIFVQTLFLISLVYFFGWNPLFYLTLSTFFSVGLHPLGARWIQEHFVVKANQETYSYYGPLNNVAFNVGYHNEHHDFMLVPWSKLPKVRRLAPEFYDRLYFHKSWTGLFFTFLFKRNISLFSRVVRD